jgi:copper chaperone NosL
LPRRDEANESNAENFQTETIDMKTKLTTAARLWLLFGALQLIPVLFIPFWKIQLYAPQYPEGLEMKIWTNKLSGDVDIINGLNHYIGMHKIVEEEFVEFKVLPVMIIAMVLLGALAALWNRRAGLYIYFGLFLLVSVVAMSDFYRWEYQYGHNLDSTAPIQVPGMAYQPPLIGYKQLLNFLAFSFPDVGGFMYTVAGVLIGIAFMLEFMRQRKEARATNPIKNDNEKMTKPTLATIGIMLMLVACSVDPQPIKYGSDQCDFCKMTIMDKRFAAEVMTKKGKAYKFDDVRCMSNFLLGDNVKVDNVEGMYVTTYTDNAFIRVGEAQFMKAEELRSPMGGNVAAFADAAARDKAAKEMNGRAVTWEEINRK